MASEQQTAGSPPSAQLVGNAFVHQYYHILHQSPEYVYRFYKDVSKLGRPEIHGAMSSTTTMQAINDKIMSMDYKEFRAEIKTVDAQESLGGGMIVLVTGLLTNGKNNVRRGFTQSFFLATQDKGYFVLNDIFRYVEEFEHQEQGNQALVNSSPAISSIKQEVAIQEQQIPVQSVSSAEEEGEDAEEVYDPLELEEGSVVEEEETVGEVIDEVPNISQEPAFDSGSITVHEEGPKKSYASIVKEVMKENVAPPLVPAPAPSRPPAKSERQTSAAPTIPAPASEVSAAGLNVTESISAREAEADSNSIYIKNLPLNANADQLEEEFKSFGPIKKGGVQVRSHKQQGFCFGFVEFEMASAVQTAIEASPVMIGGRQVYVEEKRRSGPQVNRGSFLPGRGGFRNDGARGRGNHRGGRGYGRGDYGNRTDFGGRGGGRVGNPWRQRIPESRPEEPHKTSWRRRWIPES